MNPRLVLPLALALTIPALHAAAVGREDLTRLFVQIQLEAAMHGGGLNPASRAILARMCDALGITAPAPTRNTVVCPSAVNGWKNCSPVISRWPRREPKPRTPTAIPGCINCVMSPGESIRSFCSTGVGSAATSASGFLQFLLGDNFWSCGVGAEGDRRGACVGSGAP